MKRVTQDLHSTVHFLIIIVLLNTELFLKYQNHISCSLKKSEKNKNKKYQKTHQRFF